MSQTILVYFLTIDAPTQKHKKKLAINYGLTPCANLYMTILRIFGMGRGSLTKNGYLTRKGVI